jgi:hypothetical protein
MNAADELIKPSADGIIRIVDRGTPLHAGTVVYRVIEVDLPPDIQGPHTWKVAAVVVERASDKQIKLKQAFPGLHRKVFEPTAFGRVFFETTQQAIQCFLTEYRSEIVRQCNRILALEAGLREACDLLAVAEQRLRVLAGGAP